MTIIQNYSQWKESSKKLAVESDLKVDCIECNGWGEVECCGHERECKECFGEGKIKISEGGVYKPSKKDYKDDVTNQLIKLCAHTNGNLFEEMCSFLSQEGR